MSRAHVAAERNISTAMESDLKNLASYIDHTMLRVYATSEEVSALCKEAIAHKFASACIPPYFVRQASELMTDEKVKTCTVIGFPTGHHTTQVKIEEMKVAIEDGADELDIVVNVAAVKSNDWNYIDEELKSMVNEAHSNDKVIKVILETCYLTHDEIKRLCDICNERKPDFAKTSTGFGSGGAALEIVELMYGHLDKCVKIKASGGIRNREQALSFINAGATRIGTSGGIEIISND